MSPGRHGRNASIVSSNTGQPSASRGRHRSGDIGRFAQAKSIGRTDLGIALIRNEVVVAIDPDQRHGAVAEPRGGPTRVEALERGLGIGLVRDQLSEQVVGEVDHGACRSEVRRQPHVVGADLIGRAQVLRDVGAAESVDRLLGVADDEQATGQREQISPSSVFVGLGRGSLRRIIGIRREADGDLELDWVGVLEFVEQDSFVALVEQSTDVGVIGDQTTREHEEVVELELARRGAFSRPVEDEPPDDRPEQQPAVSFDALEGLVGDPAEFDLVGAERLECIGAIGAEGARPLPLGTGKALAFRTPVSVLDVERPDGFESGAQTLAGQARGQRHELGDGRDLRVVVGDRGRPDVVGERSDGRDVEVERAGVGQLDAVVHEIPVGAEVLGHATGALVDAEPVEFAEFDEGASAGDQTARRLGVVEQRVEQVVPLLLEGEPALEFVEHGEPRWQPGLDREVEQDAAGERVQRADRCMIESGERRVGFGARVCFEALACAAAQLGGGLLGEGDRRDRRDRDP